MLIIILFILTFNLAAQPVITNYARGLKGVELYGVYFINKKPPEYLEDYYELYYERLYYGEENIDLNLYFLNKALNSPFRPENKALCLLETEKHRDKYRLLLKMHIYLKIMQNYLLLGRLYDKPRLYFFNLPFKKDLLKSFEIAKKNYKKAKEYWKKVLEYAQKANRYDVYVPLDHLEDELYRIINRDKEVDWDYDYIIDFHLNRLNRNIRYLKNKK